MPPAGSALGATAGRRACGVAEPHLLAGRYELQGPVDSEGVRRAWDRVTEREVTLRTMRVEEGAARDRWCHEGRILVRIHHPCVMDIRDVLVDDGLPWVTLSVVPEEDPTLADLLAGHGITADPIERVQVILVSGELGRFAPGADDPQHAKSLLQEVDILIAALEKEL